MTFAAILNADASRIPLADRSVHCVVTSPPYWGLRDYGLDERGIGLEKTPEAFLERMVGVFREVKRVLRDDGTCWVNMGDAYSAQPGQRKTTDKAGPKQASDEGSIGAPSRSVSGLKAKDLIGMPWRLAFALQADGWYLRQDIIWHKPNPMPESVTDRCTKAHEYLFLLTKSARYWYDAEAVKEPGISPEVSVDEYADALRDTSEQWHQRIHDPFNGEKKSDNNLMAGKCPPGGRNKRSVWTISTQSYSGAHFATFPEKLVEPCILAGTSAKGCCPVCGTGWVRVIDKRRELTRLGDGCKVNAFRNSNKYVNNASFGNSGELVVGNRDPERHCTVSTTTGWKPACECGRTDNVPAVVFDPFAGSGTTVAVALRLGRSAVGTELNLEEYIPLARRRIGNVTPPLFAAG